MLAADVVYECTSEDWESQLALGAEGVKLCLAAGAAVDAVDHAGRTPLFLAAKAGQQASALLLLEARADPAAVVPQGELQATPLSSAEAVASGATEATWCMHAECCARIASAMGPGP